MPSTRAAPISVVLSDIRVLVQGINAALPALPMKSPPPPVPFIGEKGKGKEKTYLIV
jgi:hypothetical protein